MGAKGGRPGAVSRDAIPYEVSEPQLLRMGFEMHLGSLLSVGAVCTWINGIRPKARLLGTNSCWAVRTGVPYGQKAPSKVEPGNKGL